jgi:hypothetical protein
MGTDDTLCAASTSSIACVDCTTQLLTCQCLTLGLCACQ